MKKRLFSFLALVLVVALCMPLIVACDFNTGSNENKDADETKKPSAETTDGDFKFKLDNSTDEYAVTDYTGNAKTVVVPDSYNGKPVTRIEKNAFLKTTATVIELPDSIVSIGDGAFKNSESLVEIYIGTSDPDLEEIGKEAFLGCKNLEAIHYCGGASDWSKISLGKNWDKNAGINTAEGAYGLYLQENAAPPEDDSDSEGNNNNNNNVTDEETTDDNVIEDVRDYTAQYIYNSYTGYFPKNWNPHTWENNTGREVLDYIEAPLADITAKDTATGEYQWIFIAASDITDVTKYHQDDLIKYGVADTSATKDYVYEIKLRPEMKWEDGTPINADTYIYSMKALLDPAMRNYRANNYYSGESAIAGAKAYYDQGTPIYAPVVPAYGEGETPDYSFNIDGYDIYINLTTTGMTFAGYSFYEICYDYGYISTDTYYSVGTPDIYGYVQVTAENKEAVLKMMEEYCSAFSISIFNEDGTVNEDYYKEFLFYDTKEVGAAVDFDKVGLYKVDDYTIRYVCANAYDYYYFLTSCTSNWIVHEELYESCKVTDKTTGIVTSTYGTSKETTMSYGPYRMDSFSPDNKIVYVQNENYFEYTKNANGSLSSTTETIGFKVDGEYQPQYITEKIVITYMSDDEARLAFLSGRLDEWLPYSDEIVDYADSDRLYKTEETYTMRLFFHTDLEALKSMDRAGNQNSVVMSNENFRKALSLAIKRDEFVTATAGYKEAYYLINSLYFYDVYEDPASIYRNTEEAMQAICNVYGVNYGPGTPYATLKEAYDSITGYNLEEARALMKIACEELVAAGLYTAGEHIVIQMAWSRGTMSFSDRQQVALLNQYVNAAVEGSGFGKINLVAVDNIPSRYNDVAEGKYAIGWGAWGGAAFYPFTMFRVYCDPEYTALNEAGCWDPTVETLTLTIDGEEVTMTWCEWSNSMTGAGKYADASNETKLAVLAGIEENFIEKYYCIPICSTTTCQMMSYKVSYFTENYNIMYGFGGMRLLRYNYTELEWADYLNSHYNGLDY